MYTDLSKTDAIATPIKSVLIPPLKTQAQSSSAPQSGLIPVDTDNDYGTECRRMCAYNVPVSWYCIELPYSRYVLSSLSFVLFILEQATTKV